MLVATLTPVGALSGQLSGAGQMSGTIGNLRIPPNYYDTSTADFAAGDLLQGKTAFGQNGAVQGEMVERDTTWLNIETPTIAYTLPRGFYRNGVVVAVDPANFTDCQSYNIRQGKTILGVDGSFVWDWMGDGATFVKNIYNSSFALSSTTFPSWTPSTTAKSIKSSTTVSAEAFAADMSQYEYIIRWRCQFTAAYNTGATKKAQVYKEIADMYQVVFRRPNTVTNIENSNFNYNVCSTLYTTPLTVYYNADGNLTPYFSISYGIYPSATSAGLSSTSAESITITPKTPAYNARCNATYFATGRAPELDTTNSIIKIKGDLYRIPIHSTLRTMYEDLTYLYNHPLE